MRRTTKAVRGGDEEAITWPKNSWLLRQPRIDSPTVQMISLRISAGTPGDMSRAHNSESRPQPATFFWAGDTTWVALAGDTNVLTTCGGKITVRLSLFPFYLETGCKVVYLKHGMYIANLLYRPAASWFTFWLLAWLKKRCDVLHAGFWLRKAINFKIEFNLNQF